MEKFNTFNNKKIIFYCQDVIRIHTANKRENEEYWHILDEKKFKAHLAISRIIFEFYNKRESEQKDWNEIKNIHDNIQFITTDLQKSIGFMFKKYYTINDIEYYSQKLAEVIIDFVKNSQWSSLIKSKTNSKLKNKIIWPIIK